MPYLLILQDKDLNEHPLRELIPRFLPAVVWFGLVLRHTNHCWLFNAKSIFIHINSSISNNSVLHFNKIKWFRVLICIPNNSFKNLSFLYTLLNDQTVLFQIIQFSIIPGGVFTQLNIKFQTIQFSVNSQFSIITDCHEF